MTDFPDSCKTADGAPIYPGMTVYTIEPWSEYPGPDPDIVFRMEYDKDTDEVYIMLKGESCVICYECNSINGDWTSRNKLYADPERAREAIERYRREGPDD